MRKFALGALIAASLTAPANAKEYGMGDFLYKDGYVESVSIVACHPSDLAFTILVFRAYDRGTLAWTVTLKMGDQVFFKPNFDKSNPARTYTFNSMTNCKADFIETQQ